VELTDERIARNQSTFRDANEQIEQAAEEYGLRGPTPFICECAESTCSEILHLSVDEYEAVRAAPRQFVVAPGHHAAAGASVRVISEHEGFTIAEKIGRAGEVAARLDPRADEPASSTG
jgi:hypothetical protein